MPAVLEPVDTATSSDRDDDMIHLFCGECNQYQITICGRALQDAEVIDADGAEVVECVVCAAMLLAPCPLCGA